MEEAGETALNPEESAPSSTTLRLKSGGNTFWFETFMCSAWFWSPVRTG